jgi:hypothetical protein
MRLARGRQVSAATHGVARPLGSVAISGRSDIKVEYRSEFSTIKRSIRATALHRFALSLTHLL